MSNPPVHAVRGDDLLARVRELPAARPLLSRLPPAAPVFLVGGAVRDLLRGEIPTDLDLVVEGDAAALAREIGGEVRVHAPFGTAAVALDGASFDLAGARRERYPRPGALPVVEPAGLEEDLGRRDFTVNALALGLGGPRRGELIAVQGALADLEARLLRVLHRGSFADDPTRLYRLARYASRLHFAPDPETLALAIAAVAGGVVGTVTGERLGAELRLLAREPDPVAALRAVHRLELDEALAHRFGLTDEDAAHRALALLPADGRRDLVALAAAGLRLDRGALGDLLARLGFPGAEKDVIVAAATRARAASAELAAASAPSQAAAVLAGAPVELAALAGALGAEEAAKRWLAEGRHVRLEIDGDALLAAGVAPGPRVGEGLRAALAAKLDGRASGPEEELAVALAAARRAG